jgi:hypothetical protein
VHTGATAGHSVGELGRPASSPGCSPPDAMRLVGSGAGHGQGRRHRATGTAVLGGDGRGRSLEAHGLTPRTSTARGGSSRPGRWSGPRSPPTRPPGRGCACPGGRGVSTPAHGPGGGCAARGRRHRLISDPVLPRCPTGRRRGRDRRGRWSGSSTRSARRCGGAVHAHHDRPGGGR